MAQMPVRPTEPAPPVPAVPRRGRGARRRREDLAGYVFLSPWLLGLAGITAIPMLISLYLSFTDYSPLGSVADANWIGLANYRRMFTTDPSYWHAVRVTVTFALVAVPLKLAAALGVALLLNRGFRGIAWFRGMFYLPSLLGGSVARAGDPPAWQTMPSGYNTVQTPPAPAGEPGFVSVAMTAQPDWEGDLMERADLKIRRWAEDLEENSESPRRFSWLW